MKVAILLTGDIRDLSTINEFIVHLSNFDVFCGTYMINLEHCNKLGKHNKTCSINNTNNMTLPSGINIDQIQQNMLQWLHLDNILKSYIIKKR